jgi:hypothetical protein
MDMSSGLTAKYIHYLLITGRAPIPPSPDDSYGVLNETEIEQLQDIRNGIVQRMAADAEDLGYEE